MTKAISRLAILALAAAISAPAPAGAQAQTFSDEEFCRALTEDAATVNRRNPSWIDATIRNDGMTVFCLQKTIEYRLYMTVDPSALTEDWALRRALFWNKKNCREPMLMAIRGGWQIVEILQLRKSLRYPEGRRHRVVAVCN